MTNIRAVACVAVALTAGITVSGVAQDTSVELVTVVGCLAQESGQLPWMLDKATEGTVVKTPSTTKEEIEASAAQALGSLTYRLLGSGEFDVEPHVGHKVQVKGLKLLHEGGWRLNMTSFQHLAPDCR